MRRLLKFMRLSAEDKSLLIRIAISLWAIRLGLWILPFRSVWGLTNRWARVNNARSTGTGSIAKVVWGVRGISCYVPGATCLTQSLGTWMLLRNRGYCADLRIGVAKGSEGKLQAHAWVESNGKIVIGKKKGLPRYTALPRLEEVSR